MAIEIELFRIGLDVWHGADFHLVRPDGAPQYAFLHFLSPVRFVAGGDTHDLDPGQCVFMSPSFPREYSALGGRFGNDVLHVRGPGVKRILSKHGIPVDQPLSPRTTGFVGPMLREINLELMEGDASSLDAQRLLFDLFCLRLGRQLRSRHAMRLSPAKSEMMGLLQGLRAKIATAFSRPWSVDQMAAEVHLSRSHFLALYRELFDSTPMHDVVVARIAHAKYLLGSSTLPVGAIASACGFSSVYHFSRSFRQHAGCSPSSFRSG